ncbi:hypothetical protein [Candidatus Berkiella aquae]|uniref:Uncharacterized protein n=1 Tax=Candidatus Berkiella aquae TaxID=295108 RepID=A0A0Q9Z0H8_9GAMM|nr:hypothetical protein [Candidatus Berkiella aquae]MCS5710340.1 hypothetical protein [Candidatus Berkiella aquae]
MPKERVFFQCGNNLFTIPLNNEIANKLKNNLAKYATTRDINVNFVKTQDETVEISSEEYLIFKEDLFVKRAGVPVHE